MAATGAEGFSFLAAAFNFDDSGLMIAFSQLIKLLPRFRYINVYFGDLLERFLDSIGSKLEPPTSDTKYMILN